MGNTEALIIGTRHRDISTAIPICHAPCGKLGFRAIVALLGRMEVLLQVPRDTAQGLQGQYSMGSGLLNADTVLCIA